MKKYQSVFKNNKSIKERFDEKISYLDMYKTASDEIFKNVESLMKQFNAPRIDIYKCLAELFNELANQADLEMAEKAKMQKR